MKIDQDNFFVDSEDSNTRSPLRPHRRVIFHVRRNLLCFIHVQLFDENMSEPLTNESYILRGKNTGTNITGNTDEQGILQHFRIPDDDYELECRGYVEIVEAYYIEDQNEYGVIPYKLRIVEQSSGSGSRS